MVGLFQEIEATQFPFFLWSDIVYQESRERLERPGDIVFLVDITRSMQRCLHVLQNSIGGFLEQISRNRSHLLKKSRQRDDLYGIVAKLGNDLTDAARCT